MDTLCPDLQTVDIGSVQKRSHEDVYVAQKSPDGTFRYYAVYDGHGASHMLKDGHIAHTLAYGYKNIYPLHYYVKLNIDVCLEQGIRDAGNLKIAICSAFVSFEELAYTAGCYGGSCATVAVILALGSKSFIYAINLGDSRICIYPISDPDNIIHITKDHVPTNLDEMVRISTAGGFVYAGRVNGILAVSRSFGDWELKNLTGYGNDMTLREHAKNLVSVIPDVFSMLTSSSSGLRIMLTSDGPYEASVTCGELINRYEDLRSIGLGVDGLMFEIVPKTSDDTTIMFVDV